jgi:putative tryptophan/tyrosine transport system substrate-binding protein
MRRREFIVVLAALAAAPVSVSRAQAPPKLLRVGIVSGQPRTAPLWVAFDGRLRELGYREGENLTVEYLDTHGETSLVQEGMKELVRRKVDVIVAGGNETVLEAAIGATTTLPIVMVAIDYDPLERGYVKTLARPGGTITGVFFRQIELAVKRLDIMRQAFAGVRAATVFWDPLSADQWRAVARAGAELDLRLFGVELSQQPYDYEQALSQSPTEARNVLMVMTSTVFFRERDRIADVARRHRMASIFALREYVDAGGLISYGASIGGMYQRAAEYVDRIARGSKPSDLPIEQPTKFELVVNLKTANALGLALPPSFIAPADEVIE